MSPDISQKIINKTENGFWCPSCKKDIIREKGKRIATWDAVILGGVIHYALCDSCYRSFQAATNHAASRMCEEVRDNLVERYGDFLKKRPTETK